MIRSWSLQAANTLLLNLPPDEQAAIVEYGAMLRLADLRRQLFDARHHIAELTAKYHTTLAELERSGLPDDAGYEMHEDHILWHHYAEQAAKAENAVAALEEALKSSGGALPDAS